MKVESIRNKVYIIHGQQVMLDYELAEIYGYTTARFNEQVKNNIEKFDDDFMFELNKEEFESLMPKKSISSWGGRRKLPKAFTEQLSMSEIEILRSQIATANVNNMARTLSLRLH